MSFSKTLNKKQADAKPSSPQGSPEWEKNAEEEQGTTNNGTQHPPAESPIPRPGLAPPHAPGR